MRPGGQYPGGRRRAAGAAAGVGQVRMGRERMTGLFCKDQIYVVEYAHGT